MVNRLPGKSLLLLMALGACIPLAQAADCDATFGVLASQLPKPEWDRGAPDCAPLRAASLAGIVSSLCE